MVHKYWVMIALLMLGFSAIAGTKTLTIHSKELNFDANGYMIPETISCSYRASSPVLVKTEKALQSTEKYTFTFLDNFPDNSLECQVNDFQIGLKNPTQLRKITCNLNSQDTEVNFGSSRCQCFYTKALTPKSCNPSAALKEENKEKKSANQLTVKEKFIRVLGFAMFGVGKGRHS